MFGMFKRSSSPKKFTAETIIDVRSYYSTKNHLVRYKNYKVPFSLQKTEGREALCGYTDWLARETPNPNSQWVVKPEDPEVTVKHYCSDCVEQFRNHNI